MKTELYKNVNDVVGFEVKESRENSVCLVKRCKIDEVCNGCIIRNSNDRVLVRAQRDSADSFRKMVSSIFAFLTYLSG